MKDYDHVVVWLDYFNKNLKRSKGRRLNINACIFEPTIKELTDSAKSVGYQEVESNDKARFPRRPFVRSGYVSLPKNETSKTDILAKISQQLLLKRTKKK